MMSLPLWKLLICLFASAIIWCEAVLPAVYSTESTTSHAAVDAQKVVQSSSEGGDSEHSRFELDAATAGDDDDRHTRTIDGHTFGIVQHLGDDFNVDLASPKEVQAKLLETERYILQEKMHGNSSCFNLNALCTVWAVRGECIGEPQYMQSYCAPACRMCHLLPLSKSVGGGHRKQQEQPLPNEMVQVTESSSVCTNQDETCTEDEDEGLILENPGAEFGEVQLLDDTQGLFGLDSFLQRLAATKIYVDQVRTNPRLAQEVRALCYNSFPNCILWAMQGDCNSLHERDRKFMARVCAPVCQTCHELTLDMMNEFDNDQEEFVDYDEQEEFVDYDEQEEFVDYDEQEELIGEDDEFYEEELVDNDYQEEEGLEEGLGFMFGKVQMVDQDWETGFLEKLEETRLYIEETVNKEETFSKVRAACRNQDELCTQWAMEGECENNSGYMIVNCAPACQTCHLLDYETRCAVNPEDPEAWKPGDLNRMFERILVQYDNHVKVVSRPNYLPGDDEETATYEVGPWILVIDNFLTSLEASRLIEIGTLEGYERSTGVGKVDPVTGEAEKSKTGSRTSANAWCGESCQKDPAVLEVWKRLQELTGIPKENSEHLQLLKYEEEQFYFTHHDYIDHESHSMQGPRILTVFLYLNDVEEGGETRFDWFGDRVKVQPKAGRVVLWPSVLDEDPLNPDERTQHEAMSVIRGRKYAANAWFHLRDVEKASAWGC